jgi:hypothetical protein
MRHSSNVAVGQGPERGVFRAVIPLLAEKHAFWELRHSHLVPVFSRSTNPDPDRLRWFWAFGLYQALHLALFSQGAYNCSFALALAFIQGPEGMLMTQDSIHAMDPKLGQMLDPWFALAVDDPMPTSPRDPVYQLITNVLDMQVGHSHTMGPASNVNVAFSPDIHYSQCPHTGNPRWLDLYNFPGSGTWPD